MKVIPLLLAMLIPNLLIAQSSNVSGAVTQKEEIIKYDYSTSSKPDKLIPFDRPFILQVDNFPDCKIDRILVFETEAEKGRQGLKYDRASFNIEDYEYRKPTGSLSLKFPALLAERDFNIIIVSSPSKNNLSRILRLNTVIDQKLRQGVIMDTIFKHIQTTRRDIMDSLNKRPYRYGEKYPVWLKLQDEYVSIVYSQISNHYNNLTDTTATAPNALMFVSYFNSNEIMQLAQLPGVDKVLGAKISSMKKIQDDTTIVCILSGQLPPHYVYPKQTTSCYNWNGRIENIDLSLQFFNELQSAIKIEKAKGNATLSAQEKTTDSIMNALEANRELLVSTGEAIVKHLSDSCLQANWIVGSSTTSVDFQTVSKRHFTVDAGLVNIAAFDSRGDLKQIQKLFIGANIFFKAVDKHVDFKYLKKVPDADSNYTHSLEAKNDFLHNFSITLGLTLGGSYRNKDFDNVFGNFSFTLGPSYRITRYVRAGIGAALLRRTSTNPLVTGKDTILGGYASLSFDYDLLDAAKGLFSKLFN